MGSVIKLNQALHGYANGHQLIVSSMDFSAEDKRLMDELSDLSGICGENHFTDYYTGYPITGGKRYVIARTWYAFEKQRPGCVWTHSLILNTEDVGKISCMKSFEKLFTRPKGTMYEVYGTTIEYQNTGEDIFTQYNEEKIQYVIYTLFSSIKPRYVRASQIGLDEEILLILKNLSSQLLRQFSFCTMSYDTRKLGNKEFSYQIIDRVNPYKMDRKKIHICEDISIIKKYPLWINEYYKCIKNNCLYLLNDFMDQYGENDLKFSDYSAMARLYFAVINAEDISLDDYFKYADIVRNKCDTYFYSRTLELVLDGQLKMFKEKEYEIWDMLELKKIKLKVNYQKLLTEKTIKNSPEKIYPILKNYIEGKMSSNTKEAVAEMIMELKPENLKQVSKMDENICVVLVSQNSKLLLSKDIWKMQKKFQQVILSASDRNLSDELLEYLIYIIMKYDKEPISENLYTVYGKRMIPHIYEVIKKEDFAKNINMEDWVTVLLKDPKKLLENLMYFSNTEWIKKILLLIDTYQDQNLYALDRVAWRNLYKKSRVVDKNLAIQFLPVVLKTNYLDDELRQIVSPVYEALKNDSLDFEQWNKIQALLPEVEAYQNWDRCLRVRLALKNKGYTEIKAD